MKDAMRFLATLLMGLLLAWSANAQSYVDGIDDLPLMAGLAQSGEPSVFDAAQGRVVEAQAEGRVARAAILAFYARTLPQLGWRNVAEGRFAREGEKLVLEFPPAAVAGTTVVRFFLSPE
jgi:hypothetical protein